MEKGKNIGLAGPVRGLLDSPSALRLAALRALHDEYNHEILFQDEARKGITSSVMVLLGRRTFNQDGKEICVILNKRSRRVPQSGDLCCPGGTVEANFDNYFSKVLTLPGFPLGLWPYWSEFRRKRPREARLLSLLLATGMRESWEEMRLNPMCVRFLGPLPFQRLLLFHRIIHPMVGWVYCQKRFITSWEVEKVVWIPLWSLLDPGRYARYRLHVPHHLEMKFNRSTQDMPCFLHSYKNQTELLWGATYRIVTHFLRLVFGFRPPDLTSLPMVPGILDEGYIYGRC